MEITLLEALCGFEKYFDHLDGKKHKISCKKGDIIKPDSVKTVW